MFGLLVAQSHVDQQRFHRVVLYFCKPCPHIHSGVVVVTGLCIDVGFYRPVGYVFLIQISVGIINVGDVSVQSIDIVVEVHAFKVAFFAFVSTSHTNQVRISPFVRGAQISYNLFLLQFSEVAVGSLVEFKEVQLIAAFVTEEDHLPAIRFVTVGQSVRSAPVYIPLRSQFVVSQQLVVQ